MLKPSLKRNTLFYFGEVLSNFKHRLKYYRNIKVNLKNQMVLKLNSLDSSRIINKKILVPIIETSHYQVFQILILAKALQIRGADIRILLCGSNLLGCEIKSVNKESLKDPCFHCRYNAKKILPYFMFDVFTVSDIISNEKLVEIDQETISVIEQNQNPPTKYEIDLNQCIQDSVVRYFYGAVPSDNKKTTPIRYAHTKTALTMIEVAKNIDVTWAPDIVLSNMISYSSFSPLYQYYKRYGNRYHLISMSQFNFHRVIVNQPDLFLSANRFNKFSEINPGPLNEIESSELNQYIQNRFSGKVDIFKQLSFFSDGDNPAISTLDIDSEKRNIFLFSNIYWDIGLSDYGNLFPDVITWVLQTIDILRDKKNVHLYIKPHPGEIFDSAKSLKGIRQIIEESYPELPQNISIIDPELKIKTYELFSYIDMGVIFTGTLGLEMMLSGISVIATGQTPFKDLDLAIDPKNMQEYQNALLGESSPKIIDQNILNKFAHFYFLKTLLPWTLTKRAYADNFKGFSIETLDDLLPGNDKYLDHLCNCIADPDNTVIENWD
jgi:hypothetical protein